MSQSSGMTSNVINSFAQLRVYSESYYRAAMILDEQYEKDKNYISKKITRCKQGDTWKQLAPLSSPRNHLICIALELLLKSIINEVEKSKNSNSVPDVARFKHHLTQLHQKVIEIAKGLNIDFPKLNQQLLEKAESIMIWGSRYHYTGKPEKHFQGIAIIKKIINKKDTYYGINSKKAFPQFLGNEFDNMTRLFREFQSLQKKILDKIKSNKI